MEFVCMCASLYRSFFLAFKAGARKVQEPPCYGPSGMAAVENSQAEADASSVASYTIAPMAVNMGSTSDAANVCLLIGRFADTWERQRTCRTLMQKRRTSSNQW